MRYDKLILSVIPESKHGLLSLRYFIGAGIQLKYSCQEYLTETNVVYIFGSKKNMKMFSSICCINVHITKSPILSCLPAQHNSSSSSSSSENSSPPGSKRKPREAKIPASSSPPLQKKPSVAEIERAIGAGVFRDRNTDG